MFLLSFMKSLPLSKRDSVDLDKQPKSSRMELCKFQQKDIPSADFAFCAYAGMDACWETMIKSTAK